MSLATIDSPPLTAAPPDDGFGGYLDRIRSYEAKSVEAKLHKYQAFYEASISLPADRFDPLCKELGWASPGVRSRQLTTGEKASLLLGYAAILPPKGRSLYEIARRDPAEIVKVLGSGSISSRSTIAEVKSAFGDLPEQKGTVGRRLIIKIDHLPDELIENLKEYLSGWGQPLQVYEAGGIPKDEASADAR